MRVVLVSDSHGSTDRLKKVFAFCEREKIQQVIHGGDLFVHGVEEIFAAFPNIQFYIARGNADVNEETFQELSLMDHVRIEEDLELEMEGRKILVSHIFSEQKLQNAAKSGSNFFFFGHTHKIEVFEREGVFCMNTGALTEQGSFFVFDFPSPIPSLRFFNRPEEDYPFLK